MNNVKDASRIIILCLFSNLLIQFVLTTHLLFGNKVLVSASLPNSDAWLYNPYCSLAQSTKIIGQYIIVIYFAVVTSIE